MVNWIKDDAKVDCAQCHRMGAHTIDVNRGTSTWLGLMASGENETPHLTPTSSSGRHAFWMQPSLTAPNPDDKADAVRMDACARGGNDQGSIQPWGGQIEAVSERLKGRRLPELKQPQGHKPRQRILYAGAELNRLYPGCS